jgi:hypothetical protein
MMSPTPPLRASTEQRRARSARGWFLAAVLLLTGGLVAEAVLKSGARPPHKETCWLELGVRVPVGARQAAWSGFVVLRGQCLGAGTQGSASKPSGDGRAAPVGGSPVPRPAVGRP